jgi:hypothetical protein
MIILCTNDAYNDIRHMLKMFSDQVPDTSSVRWAGRNVWPNRLRVFTNVIDMININTTSNISAHIIPSTRYQY